MVQHATDWDRASLLAHPERPVAAAQLAALAELVERRARSEPLAYVIGEQPFYGRVFRVDPRVLIPRPETELVVGQVLEAAERMRARTGRSALRILDVGTGSGAIAVSVSAELGGDRTVVATDVSFAALALARENAQRLCPARPPRFVRANLAAGLRGPFEIVAANLPYIPRGRALPESVARYEPPLALYAGATGTELIERLLEQLPGRLAPGGVVMLELDERPQATAVAQAARRAFPSAEVSILKDLAGLDRVVRLSLPD